MHGQGFLYKTTTIVFQKNVPATNTTSEHPKVPINLKEEDTTAAITAYALGRNVVSE